ncbi:MAG TPA: penicillin-binding transpeptidase domain-containing protein [Kofleriaceae bacterium]|nr:penicillin-binding transpeptidase domain-containing protein [Kofleriaceae bacterium]
MRRVVLLAGGVLLAGASVFVNAGPDHKPKKPTPKASIQGESLVAAPSGPITTPSQLSVDTKTSDVLSDLQLDKLTLEDGHYVAPLKDGRRAVLTLDPDLQKLAEKLLDQSRAPRGAIVAMSPDGRILALAGRRTEEPKGGKTGTFDYKLATDVWAPAASVFKLVTATSLVANGYDPSEKVCYHGGVRSVMESNLSDSKSDNNCETLAYGVAHSNNAILGKLAFQKLEPSLLDRTARDLGWASKQELGVEATCGELALPEKKDLEFAKAAAGFQGSRLSVLGGAMLVSTFAGKGEQPQPRIIDSIAGKPVDPGKPHRVIDEKVAEAVTKMMVGTCASGSAAKSFRRSDNNVAGKTGTLTTNKPFYMEHSWFVGFAPADKPEIIVSVLLGNPESWHLRGHEAAKRMIDRALSAKSSAPDLSDEPSKSAAKRPK